MSTVWETEDDEAQSAPAPPKTEFKVKAYLVLVDSDDCNFGIVEDTMNNILWQPGKGEVVGTWSKAEYDDLIHINLATAISALEDRSIQTFVRYAEARRQEKERAKKPKRVKKAGEPVQEEVQVAELSLDEKLKFNALRAKLGRAR